MNVVSEPYFDMHANTQRQLEAYTFASQPGFIVANDSAHRIITISGPVTDRMLHDAVSPLHGVENQFHGYFAPSDVSVSITPTRPGSPDHFHVALSGNAYSDMLAGEAAEREIAASGKKPRFLGDVMGERAFAAINKPENTVAEFPGLNGGTVTISGPVVERARFGMQSYLSEYFGEGVRVTQQDGRFSATLTGSAYARYRAGQAAHEAAHPVAIGH